MANKRQSDTISQQRKARKEFLELKKMQNGDATPPPKPSEVEVLPQTPKEKWQNFWYHFKWHTIVSIGMVIFLAITISQCMSRTKWDMKIVYFTYSPILDQQLEPVADYFESKSKDLNGDGEVNISVINCSLSTNKTDAQFDQAKLTKLQAIIAGEPEAILFITDKDSIEFFSSDTFKNFFKNEPQPLSDDFYKACKYSALPKELQISSREISGTLLENDKKSQKVYNECQKLLEKIKD
ncbi:MAG: hypothetical protein J6B22_01165 [Clostridia bacterium]|nr:hypothetical protein [Clostridia bacterium]